MRSACLAIALLVTVISSRETEAFPSEVVATLDLRDLEGEPEDLGQYRGRIVVLNFWATWCLPCREEMPALVSLQSRFGARGVQVIAASADEPGATRDVARFERKQELNFPVWVGATTADMERLGLGAVLPATAIIDRDGVILGRIIGVIDAADLEQRVEWLLGDRSEPAPLPVAQNVDEHGHVHHEGEEEHEHGGVGIEGASLVPS